jgi:hypothetical protein
MKMLSDERDDVTGSDGTVETLEGVRGSAVDAETVDELTTDVDEGRCGATTRDGSPCRKWPVGGAGEGRCRLHGGASTGPDEPATEHLEGNDYAAGNDGGPPVGNTNAQIHGGFGDWRQVYDRLEGDERELVERLERDHLEVAAEHAPDVSASRRERLCREKATLVVMARRASADVWCDPDGSGPGRGLVVERTVTTDAGDTVTVHSRNAASRARHTLRRREREIARTLRLWPAYQNG